MSAAVAGASGRGTTRALVTSRTNAVSGWLGTPTRRPDSRMSVSQRPAGWWKLLPGSVREDQDVGVDQHQRQYGPSAMMAG
jgi:hypothetical protein